MTTPDREPQGPASSFIPGEDLLRAITPLRQIFWGGLLCVVDLRVNGFDILNDFVGMLLITTGVFRLGAIPVARSYARGMRFIKGVAVLSTIRTFINQFAFEKPPAVQFLWTLYGLVDLAAILVFTATMGLFCTAAHLRESAASWRTTMNLFIVLYALPLGIFYLVSAAATATGSRFHVNLGPAGFVVVVPLLIPLVHLFISTSRMRRSALEAVSPTD
jgi:hypothetical protein